MLFLFLFLFHSQRFWDELDMSYERVAHFYETKIIEFQETLNLLNRQLVALVWKLFYFKKEKKRKWTL